MGTVKLSCGATFDRSWAKILRENIAEQKNRKKPSVKILDVHFNTWILTLDQAIEIYRLMLDDPTWTRRPNTVGVAGGDTGWHICTGSRGTKRDYPVYIEYAYDSVTSKFVGYSSSERGMDDYMFGSFADALDYFNTIQRTTSDDTEDMLGQTVFNWE